MKKRIIITSSVLLLMLTLSFAVAAQDRPYHNGSVWTISLIQIKPGMDTAYLNYIATDWKRIQTAAKKNGLILSYKVLTTESHGSGDWNIMLMTEYKDLATMEANEAKADKLFQTTIGTDEKQMEGYRERLKIREVLEGRLAREIILEPKK